MINLKQVKILIENGFIAKGLELLGSKINATYLTRFNDLLTDYRMYRVPYSDFIRLKSGLVDQILYEIDNLEKINNLENLKTEKIINIMNINEVNNYGTMINADNLITGEAFLNSLTSNTNKYSEEEKNIIKIAGAFAKEEEKKEIVESIEKKDNEKIESFLKKYCVPALKMLGKVVLTGVAAKYGIDLTSYIME